MTAKTWVFRDLESVVEKRDVACLCSALAHRIVREAIAVFDAPNGAIVLEVGRPRATNDDAMCVESTLHFVNFDLAWGRPSVGVRIEQRNDHRFSVRIGGSIGTAAMGYAYDFGWVEETPAALFPALFSCVLESIRTNKAVK